MANESLPDYYKSIQILSLQNVVKSTPEYLERFVLRWFSKEFHTPYSEVKEMPFEEVLTAFYECRYAEMEEEKLQEEVRNLTETPEERVERLAREEAEEASIQKLVADSATKNQKMQDVVPPLIPVPKPTKEADLPSDLKSLIKPDIEMKFTDNADFEKLVESIDALAATRKSSR